jgi:uncharacterized protein YeaO (DUF488 family)
MSNPLAFLKIWGCAQDALNQEMRWKHFLIGNHGIRQQTVLQHSYSLSLLLNWVLLQLHAYLIIAQKGLIKNACLLESWADAELRRPDDLVHREPQHDLEDFQAFHSRFKELDGHTYDYFRRAFLLQFVGNSSLELFAPDEQRVLRDLQENCSLEASLLAFVRHVDYYYYAVEQLKKHNDARVLREVLLNTLERMDQLAERVPGAKDVIWRPLREKCLRMAETGQFIE